MTATTSPEQATTLLPLDTQAPYYKWLVAGIVLMASGTQTFAGNSITLAIPCLMAPLGADLAAAQWVMTGFLIARTLVIPLLGWLGGLLGHRTLFVVGMAGFFVCTIGRGLSTSLVMLIAFRLLQGLLLGSLGGLNSINLELSQVPDGRESPGMAPPGEYLRFRPAYLAAGTPPRDPGAHCGRCERPDS
ncbi:hypothetical protein C2W62_30020 [Candidatus Entotheonella serta]|nr:hypothetical protein C2W62_30020 [Candidatus Entotheonella serta]